MAFLQPPITGDPQLDSWTLRLTQQINQGLVPGAAAQGGGGGGGAQGDPGADGQNGNSALYLYQRTTTDVAPTRPTSVTFSFATTGLTVTANEGWTNDLPETGGEYLWVTLRYVAEQSGTITGASSWDTPVLLGTPGEDSVTIELTIREPGSSSFTQRQALWDDADDTTFDPLDLTFNAEGMEFGSEDEVKVLLAVPRVGTDIPSLADRKGYTYQWMRNSTTFNPDITGVITTLPFIYININDLQTNRQDQFTCTITST